MGDIKNEEKKKLEGVRIVKIQDSYKIPKEKFERKDIHKDDLLSFSFINSAMKIGKKLLDEGLIKIEKKESKEDFEFILTAYAAEKRENVQTEKN